jgi:hypothetical protein
MKKLFAFLIVFLIFTEGALANSITAAAVFEIKESNNTMNITNNSMNNGITGYSVIKTENKGLISRFLDWLLRLWNN